MTPLRRGAGRAAAGDRWAGRPVDRPRPGLLGRAHQSFVTAGRLVVMSAAVARYLVTDIPSGRFPFREFVAQAWFVLSVSVVPTLLVTVPFG